MQLSLNIVQVCQSMRAYINAHNPKTISAVIHHLMLAHKIFSSKEEKKAVEKGDKSWEQSDKNKKNEKNNKSSNDKKSYDSKKDKGPYKGPNKGFGDLSQGEQMFQLRAIRAHIPYVPHKEEEGGSHGFKRGSQQGS